jgi:hypothetical protein
MNLEKLPRDIICIIFTQFEKEEGVLYKNNLSMTCSRLYQINKERRNNYWKKFTNKNPQFPIKYQKPYWNYTFIDDCFDLVHEELNIGFENFRTRRLIDIQEQKYRNIFFFLESFMKNPSKSFNIEKIKSLDVKILFQMKKFSHIEQKDILLVVDQTHACPLMCDAYLYFNDGDLVNSIFSLQS